MNLIVIGAGGRMGRTLVKAITQTDGMQVSGAIERAGSAALGRDAGVLAGLPAIGVPVLDDPLPLFAKADGVIDFSSPAASVQYAALAAQARIVHVIGTTGLSADDMAKIEAASRHAVIIQSGNMSLGVNLLASLVKKVARTLGPEFDIEIVEMHHRMKVDAPSGTALLLGDAAAKGRNILLNDNKESGRDGHTGARKEGAIGFAALRGGSVIGDHTVMFAGAGERIELRHIAEDRGLFAQGALKAALWGRGKKPGLYTMADVLGLDD
ncbi:MAG: 4-hydroxy-tetrahydrodipicolinate reductase [Beijerinckiaceae bacterium]